MGLQLWQVGRVRWLRPVELRALVAQKQKRGSVMACMPRDMEGQGSSARAKLVVRFARAWRGSQDASVGADRADGSDQLDRTDLLRATKHSRRKHRPTWPAVPWPALAMLAALIGAWELVARIAALPAFILPEPGTVFSSLVDLWRDGTLTSNAGVTLEEAGAGLGIALVIALPLGYAMARVRLLEQLLAPLLATSQAVPMLAVAPLLVLWLDTGLQMHVAVCAVIVVFPLLVSCITAIRGVSREYLEVAYVFGVPWYERILRVELPLAAPVLLAGLKVGAALALTGAIVGEFVASSSGLGFLLNYYRDNLYTAGEFATLVVLASIGILAFWFISRLERAVARWQE